MIILIQLEGTQNFPKNNNLSNNQPINVQGEQYEMKNIIQRIEDSLKNKTLEDLIFIYYNIEDYIFNFLESYRKDNLKLLEEVNFKFQALQSRQDTQNQIQSQIFSSQKEIEAKERALRGLIEEKNNIQNIFNPSTIISKLKRELKEKYEDPKNRLINDLRDGKINYEEYMGKFKDIAMKYYYYKTIIEKIENQ